MDCVEVEKRDLIERYLSHDLSKDEEREFEEHYFLCEQCANAVYLLENIIHQAKVISLADKKATVPELTKEPFSLLIKLWNSLVRIIATIDNHLQTLTRPLAISLAATLVLFIVVGIKYADLRNQLHHLKQPSVNTVYVSLFPEGALKGVEDNLNIIIFPKYSKAITLEFGIDAIEKYNRYAAAILNNRNRIIWHNDDLRPMGVYNTFSLVAPKNFFKQEDYVLVVSGLSDNRKIELQKFPFRIVFE